MPRSPSREPQGLGTFLNTTKGVGSTPGSVLVGLVMFRIQSSDAAASTLSFVVSAGARTAGEGGAAGFGPKPNNVVLKNVKPDPRPASRSISMLKWRSSRA